MLHFINFYWGCLPVCLFGILLHMANTAYFQKRKVLLLHTKHWFRPCTVRVVCAVYCCCTCRVATVSFLSYSTTTCVSFYIVFSTRFLSHGVSVPFDFVSFFILNNQVNLFGLPQLRIRYRVVHHEKPKNESVIYIYILFLWFFGLCCV